MDLTPISKAIAGGLVTLLVGECAKYLFQPSAEQVTALGVLVTGVVSYLFGHIVVYLAPKNKETK
jgi:hypothetical protein